MSKVSIVPIPITFKSVAVIPAPTTKPLLISTFEFTSIVFENVDIPLTDILVAPIPFTFMVEIYAAFSTFNDDAVIIPVTIWLPNK